MPRIGRLACVVVLTIASSLQAQSGLPPGTWPMAKAPPELRPAVSRGDLIIVSLQDALLSELTDALEEGGPTFAIKSCHIDVTGIVRRIERSEGITAGRTSDRLRNPSNAPRPWAAPLVASHAGRKAKDVDGFVVDLGDKIGLLHPLHTARSADRAMAVRTSSQATSKTLCAIGTPQTALSGSSKERFVAGSGSRCQRRENDSGS